MQCTWPVAGVCVLKGIDGVIVIDNSNKLAGISWNWEWSMIKTKRKWREWRRMLAGNWSAGQFELFSDSTFLVSESATPCLTGAVRLQRSITGRMLQTESWSTVRRWNTRCTRNSNWIWQHLSETVPSSRNEMWWHGAWKYQLKWSD